MMADANGIHVRRLPRNPIITSAMMGQVRSENINGPSLIRVPNWIERPLGRHYLYFAHHGGESIRLAYADDLEGPYRVYQPCTLRLEQTICHGHIASPDVFVDHEQRRIRMYFHGPRPNGQRTFRALSPDGLSFTAETADLGPFYFRVFEYEGAFYAIGKDRSRGVLCRSEDGAKPFEPGPEVLPRMRHCAVRRRGDEIEIYFSAIGDDPERIVMSRMKLCGDWRDWRADEPREVLAPEMEWEGARCPAEPSASGAVFGPVRQLRDPCIFEEAGRVYLLYSVAGESGIAVAELQQTEAGTNTAG